MCIQADLKQKLYYEIANKMYFFFIYTQTRVKCLVSMHNGKHFTITVIICIYKFLTQNVYLSKYYFFSIRTNISNFANLIRQYSNKFLVERRCALFADSCMFDLTSALQKFHRNKLFQCFYLFEIFLYV